jgi:iron complex outermembrane recepter protein
LSGQIVVFATSVDLGVHLHHASTCDVPAFVSSFIAPSVLTLLITAPTKTSLGVHAMNPRSKPRPQAAVSALSGISLAVMLAIGVAYVAPSYAQATATPPAKKDEEKKVDDSKLETITVTAQRREQELQAVPLPVSTFTSRELELRGVTSTLKIAEYIPNMFASNNTGLGTANQYFLRGLGNTETIATFDPPVGTYVNDIYVSRQNANNFGFYDVERIEVLRGPQGTLFGRNTTGGAINVILKKPAAKLGGYFEAGLGSWGETNSRGSVDIPLSQDFRTKFSYYFKRDEGYGRNITTGEKTNNQDMRGVRAAMWWRINSMLTWDLSVDNSDDSGLSLSNRKVGDDRIVRTGLRADCPGIVTVTGRLTGDKSNYCMGNNVNNTAVTSNLNLFVGGFSVDFISGYRDLRHKFALDFGDTPVPSGGFTIVNDGIHKQFTQEVKATGEFGNLSFVGGMFYLSERNRTDFADVFNTVFSGAPQPGLTLTLADRLLQNKTKSTAVYAQGDYKITPALTGTLGVRFTDEEKTISFSDNRATAAPATQLSDANIRAAGIPLSQQTRLTTPRAALSYQISPDAMVFASATRGFKSGGWNARGTAAFELQPFAPEVVWSYEAGWRTSWLGNRLRFNGTFFRADVEKLQTPSAFTRPNGTVAFITRNFADLQNQGLELELSATPARGLNVYLNAGFQDSEYTNIASPILDQQTRCRAQIAGGGARPDCQQGIVNSQGNISIPVRSPKQTYSAGVNYTFPAFGDFKLAPAANLVRRSRANVGTAENAFAEAHTLLNASIGLISPSNNWRVTLDCTNCSNKAYTTAFLAGFLYLNDPRRFGLKLNYTFK